MGLRTEGVLVAAGLAAIGAFFFWPVAVTPPIVPVEQTDPSWAASRDSAAQVVDVLTLQAECLAADVAGDGEAAPCKALERLLQDLAPETGPANSGEPASDGPSASSEVTL